MCGISSIVLDSQPRLLLGAEMVSLEDESLWQYKEQEIQLMKEAHPTRPTA